jgi:hypothetical protein
MSEEKQEKKSSSKKPGWHSRRHQTADAQHTATTLYQNEHGPEARQDKADARERDRATRTPAQQIAVLDRRLGVGVGAVKERARL